MLAPTFTKTGTNTYRLTLNLKTANFPTGYDSYDVGIQFDTTKVRLDSTVYNFSGDLKQINTSALASGTLVAAGISGTAMPAATPLVNLDFTDLSSAFLLVSVNKLTINGIEYASASKVQALSSASTPGSVINGTAVANRLVSTAGNDTINAGAGTDTVIFGTASSNVSVYRATSSEVVVTNIVTGEVDTITNGERIKFSDRSIAFDLDGAAGQAYRIYKAAFNRDPTTNDLAGLGYWISRLDGGTNTVAVGAGFISSDEFRGLYGSNPDNATFLTKLYSNVLGRSPDASGYNWWLNELNTNATRPKVLADFAESSENKATVAELIGNGIAYIEYNA